jgi:hypothetical protein
MTSAECGFAERMRSKCDPATSGEGERPSARIGDEDIDQTVTDQLRTYSATEVFLGKLPTLADELRAPAKRSSHP